MEGRDLGTATWGPGARSTGPGVRSTGPSLVGVSSRRPSYRGRGYIGDLKKD